MNTRRVLNYGRNGNIIQSLGGDLYLVVSHDLDFNGDTVATRGDTARIPHAEAYSTERPLDADTLAMCEEAERARAEKAARATREHRLGYQIGWAIGGGIDRLFRAVGL